MEGLYAHIILTHEFVDIVGDEVLLLAHFLWIARQ